MTRSQLEIGGEINKKRRRYKNPITAAVARIVWMFRVMDCRHICLFCEYYRVCRIDGISKKGGQGQVNMKNAKRSEDTEQIQVINWAHWHAGKYPKLKWLHHIPNGGSRNRLEAAKLKEMGVKAGVADLFLPSPKGCYCGMYIEMKFGSNRHTDRQKEFLRDMEKAGYFVVTCYSADDAINVIEEYVSLQMPDKSSLVADDARVNISQTRKEHEMTIPNNSILKDGKVKAM